MLLVALSGAGCVSLPLLSEGPKPAPPPAPAASAKPKRPTARVAPEQVNEANAHEMGQALLDELDQDSQEEQPAAKPAGPQK